MIISFKSKETELIFQGKISKRYPENIQFVALRLLRIVDAATSIIDLQVLPGNRLEKQSEKLGRYSIRINDSRWRICFIWTVQNDAADVEIAGDFEMTKRKRLPNIHPGEVLKLDFLAPMQISVDRLSTDIGVTQTRISEILDGQRGITADIALQLAGYFGNSDRFWLNLQTQYDSAADRQTRSATDILDRLDRIISPEEDEDEDDDDLPRVRRRSRYDDFDDLDWYSTNRGDRYDDPDRSERLFGNRRERAKQDRRVSDFQTIEVDGKLAISVEDLLAAGVIFPE